MAFTFRECFDANDCGYVPKNSGGEGESHRQPGEDGNVVNDSLQVLGKVSEQPNYYWTA